MSEEYEEPSFEPMTRPTPLEVANGLWELRWQLLFQTTLTHDKDRLQQVGQLLTQPFLQVAIDGAEGDLLELRTYTTLHPESDEVFAFATGRFLSGVELLLGKLSAINGDSREVWNHWFHYGDSPIRRVPSAPSDLLCLMQQWLATTPLSSELIAPDCASWNRYWVVQRILRQLSDRSEEGGFSHPKALQSFASGYLSILEKVMTTVRSALVEYLPQDDD